MSRGLFITFEGSEGCGKSTQIRVLAERLGAAGRDVVLLREPGGTVVGEKIRDLLQYTPEAKGMVAEAELLLFAASRAQLVREKIEPALAGGAVVVADRFHDSTTVYQGVGRGLCAEAVAGVNGLAIGECVPDVTFLLDLEGEEAKARLAGRTDAVEDRMEQEPDAFYERVRAGYLALAERESERFEIMDAGLGIDRLGEQIWEVLERRSGGVFS